MGSWIPRSQIRDLGHSRVPGAPSFPRFLRKGWEESSQLSNRVNNDGLEANEFRPGLAPSVLRRIFLLLLVNAVLFSVLGGALLTRYLLPMYPLILLVAVTTFYRRVPYWQAAIAGVRLALRPRRRGQAGSTWGPETSATADRQ